MLLTWHCYVKINSDICSPFKWPFVNWSTPCLCYVRVVGGSAGISWGAREGVSALDFSSRPSVALVTGLGPVCPPGINTVVRVTNL